MNRMLILFIILFGASTIQAQGDGIQFADGNWETILKKAKSEDKLIFIDAYTTWCGPCKQMSKNIFPLEEVGSYYNANFVNVKIDMEKGEGIDIAKRYEVRAYPTFLFVDGDGELVHRGIGSQPADKFVALGQAANNPEMQLMTLERKYRAGIKEPAFLRNYATALRSSGGDYKKAASEYLGTQDDWLTSENINFLYKFTSDINSDEFAFMSKNKDAFKKELGADKFDGYISNVIRYAAYDPEMTDFDKINQLYAGFFPDKAAEYTSEFKMIHYMYSRAENAPSKFKEAAMSHMSNYKIDNASMLNSIAWSFYEKVEDKTALKAASKWSKRSVKLDNSYYNNDTLAALYYKLKKKGKAAKYAKRAIDLAKADGQDPKDTMELLDRINQL